MGSSDRIVCLVYWSDQKIF